MGYIAAVTERDSRRVLIGTAHITHTLCPDIHAQVQWNGATHYDQNGLQLSSAASSVRKLEESSNNVDVTDQYYISPPDIHWSGFRLNIDYMVATTIADSSLGYGVYIGTDCSQEIPDEEAMDFALLTDPGLTDEVAETVLVEGTRIVRLSLLIYPDEIGDVDYISFASDKPVVSFCTRLWIMGSQEAETAQQDFLRVELDLDGLTGILGLVTDPAEDWGVETFRCDANFEKIVNPLPLSQGDRFRLCLIPNQVTRDGGGYMSSINYFTFERGGVIQNAVANGQLSGDGGTTEILCEQGSELCAIDTILFNDFFDSAGSVQGSGQVFLQFGTNLDGQRYLRRAGGEIGRRNERGGMRSLSMYERGEFVAEKPVSYNVQVKPSTNEVFSADAYRCNLQNERLANSSEVFYGDSVRICIKPDDRAREAGVFIRRLRSFSFHRDVRKPQVAIGSAGNEGEDGRTLVICSQGEDVCSLKTELANWFFSSESSVEVTGVVILQYGSQNENRNVNRRLQTNEEDDDESDPGFAGRTEVSISFKVGYSSDAMDDSATWWYSSPAYLKALYVLAIILCFLNVLCCIFGCIYFCCNRHKTDEFAQKELYDVNVKDINDSEYACADSKASYHSDLEFSTVAEDNMWDKESISEYEERDDLDTKVAIRCLKNPGPEDLYQSNKAKSTVRAPPKLQDEALEKAPTRDQTWPEPNLPICPKPKLQSESKSNQRAKNPVTEDLSQPHTAKSTVKDPHESQDEALATSPTKDRTRQYEAFATAPTKDQTQSESNLPISPKPKLRSKSKSNQRVSNESELTLSLPVKRREIAKRGEDPVSQSLYGTPKLPNIDQKSHPEHDRSPQRKSLLLVKKLQTGNKPLSHSDREAIASSPSRVDSRKKKTPKKHPPFATVKQIRKKSSSVQQVQKDSPSSNESALRKKDTSPDAKAAAKSPTKVVSKKQPRPVDENKGQQAAMKKKSIDSPRSKTSTATTNNTVKGESPKRKVSSTKTIKKKSGVTDPASTSSTDCASSDFD